MNSKAKAKGRTRRTFDAVMNRLTGRAAKVTAMVVTLGTLATTIGTQYELIKKVFPSLFPVAPRSCVTVTSPAFPLKVKLSEWDDTSFRIRGTSNCTEDIGLYVTFFRDFRSADLFRLESPRADFKECKELRADFYPNCWHYKRPLVRGKGDWSWEVPLPELTPLRDPRPVDTLFINWSVRNYDDPNKPPLAGETAKVTIEADVMAAGGR